MRVLITGSSGFIGTNLMIYYNEIGCDLCGIDIKKPKIESHIKYFKPVDILDGEKLLTEFVRFKPEFVIHLAAKTDLDGRTLESYSVNIQGTKNVVLAINAINSVKKVIFASSMLVNKVGYIPRYDNDFSPNTLYGESKILSEIIIRNTISERIYWIIVRPTSIWGPWFSQPYYNFFNIVIRGRYFISNKISCTKTFGYIGNAIFQIDRLLRLLDRDLTGKIFYLGDYPPINITDWANMISETVMKNKIPQIPYFIFYFASLLGDLLKIFNIKFPINSYRLANMQTNHIIDLSKTYDVCGKPPYSQKDGILITVNWMLNKR